MQTRARDAGHTGHGPAQLCTQQEWYPWLDVAGVVGGAAMIGAGVLDDSSVVTALGAGASAGFAASAGYGFATAPGCSARSTPEAASPR